MFTNEEGEGWQQLGDALMPSSNHDASVFLEGIQKMGEQSLHSVLGGTSLPELHDALGAMFGPKPMELNAAASQFQMPGIDLFDSAAGTNAAAQPGPGAETAFVQAGPGVENLQTTALQGGTGVESLNSTGISTGTGVESLNSTGISTGTGMESLQAPVPDGIPSTGVADTSYFQPSAEASLANPSDVSAIGDIGKAVGEVMSKMTEMLGSLAQGPMGLLGGLLSFLLNIFSQILNSIGQVLNETARAAAALAADAWKKHLEMTT